MNDPEQFTGTGHWVDQLSEQVPGIEGPAQRFFTDHFVGILRDESHLVLECSFRNKHYTAQLARNAGGVFEGSFLASGAGGTWRGPVAGRLFRGTCGVLFHGTWATDSGDGRRTFWADLLADQPTSGSRFVDSSTEFMTITPRV